MGTIAKVTAGGATHAIASSAYGECTTAAATAAKTVNITADGTATIPFTLLKGTTIHVKFSNANTAASPTLNVNSTGAKAITKYGTTAAGTTTATSWSAGSVVSFTYDGTSWVMNDHIDDTNTHQTYTAFTGKPTANQTPGFGSTFTISQISQATNGQVSGTDRTVKIPNATATTSAAGLMSASDKTAIDRLKNYYDGIATISAGQTSVDIGSNIGPDVIGYVAIDSSTKEEVAVDFSANGTFSIAAAYANSITIRYIACN